MRKRWWSICIFAGVILIILSAFVYHKLRIVDQQLASLHAELGGKPMVGLPMAHGLHFSISSWRFLFLLTLIFGIVLLVLGIYSLLRLRKITRL